MSRIFKKITSRPVPPVAVTFTKAGVKYARWRARGKTKTARLSNDGQRILTESATFYAQFRDHNGTVQERPTCCKDERNALQMLAKWERQTEQILAGTLDTDELEKSKRTNDSIESALTEFQKHLHRIEASKSHHVNTISALRRLIKDCRLIKLGDLKRSRVQDWFGDRVHEGMSARNRNHFRSALLNFANWLLSTELLRQHDLRLLPKANEAADPRRQRRALTEEELSRLLAVAAERPLIEVTTVRKGPRKGERYANVRPEVIEQQRRLGQVRCLIYKTLVTTGLRKGELASLTAAQLDLTPGAESLQLDACDAKNGNGSTIPLRSDLAAELRHWIKTNGLKGSDRLFLVPVDLSQNLDRDLVLAGIPKRDDRGRTIDVHSLRHTFATRLAQAGIPMRLAQAALRRSDPRLTAVTYTDERLLNVREAIERISPIPQATERQNGSQMNSVVRTVACNCGPNGQNLSLTDKIDDTSNSQALPAVSSKMAEIVNKNHPVSSSGSVGHQLNSSGTVAHFTCLPHNAAII